MKRTVEKVLSIIGIVLNVLSIGVLFFSLLFFQTIMNDPLFEEEFENELYFSGYTEEDIDIMGDVMTWIGGVGWFFVILGVISIVLSIIGIVKLKSNTKVAGILLIISSVLSGLISIPGILLLVAAIMCFARKPKKDIDTLQTDENGYVIE